MFQPAPEWVKTTRQDAWGVDSGGYASGPASGLTERRDRPEELADGEGIGGDAGSARDVGSSGDGDDERAGGAKAGRGGKERGCWTRCT